jgi:hypothetical protein
VDFLKMNIEGAEQLAIKGMKKCVSAIANMAIGCHDFLADHVDDDWYWTESVVRQLLLVSGYEVVERRSDDHRRWARGILTRFASLMQPRKQNPGECCIDSPNRKHRLWFKIENLVALPSSSISTPGAFLVRSDLGRQELLNVIDEYTRGGGSLVEDL